MESFNTSDFITELSEKFSIEKEKLVLIFNELPVIIKRELLKGNKVKLRYLGSFVSFKKNPRTHKGFGKEFKVRGKTKVKFIPSKDLVARTKLSELNKLFDNES